MLLCVGCGDCGSRKMAGEAASFPSAVESLARAANASGKFGGVTGVLAGVHI